VNNHSINNHKIWGGKATVINNISLPQNGINVKSKSSDVIQFITEKGRVYLHASSVHGM
jgi:hypothetical protein